MKNYGMTFFVIADRIGIRDLNRCGYNGLLDGKHTFNVKYELAEYFINRATNDNMTLKIKMNMLAYDCQNPVPPKSEVDCDIKWEDSGGLDFPHIYGLLCKEAIVGVYPHIWSNTREWVPNEELEQYAVNGFHRPWNSKT